MPLFSYECHCGYLVLVECDGCPEGAAQNLSAELRRLPSDAVGLCSGLPPLLVTNKYFTAMVQTVIICADDFPFGTELNVSSVGFVFLVGDATSADSVPWHSAPMSCLIRVVMCYGSCVATRDLMHDACVLNNFELITHGEAYEMLSPGVETRGLLGGDLVGAARLIQILHNTVWPENTRVPHDDAKTISGTVSKNLVVFVGADSEEVMNCIAATVGNEVVNSTEHFRFTGFWPPKTVVSGSERDQRGLKRTETLEAPHKSFREGLCGTTLTVANEHYVSSLGVEFVHPVMFFPAMADLFMVKYGGRHAQLAVVCWPPLQHFQKVGAANGGNAPVRRLSLPVFIEQIKRWGVERCVVAATMDTDEEDTISPFEAHFCAEGGIEIVHGAFKAADKKHTHDINITAVGMARLLEMLHEAKWPERQRLMKLSESLSSDSQVNRVLFWSKATTTVEEETIIFQVLRDMEVITPRTAAEQWKVVLPPTLASAVRKGPLAVTTARNRYFEAAISVHCYGGARALTKRDSPSSAEELSPFGVVIILTTTQSCERESRNGLLTILSNCCASARGGHCRGDLVLNGPHGCESEMTQSLCAATEVEQAFVLYIVDGDENNDALVDDVEDIIKGLMSDSEVSKCTHSSGGGAEEDWDKGSNGDGSSEDLPLRTDDDSCEGSFDDLMSVVPQIEVVYGAGPENGIARLREIMNQHMWSNRVMVDKCIRSHNGSTSSSRNASFSTIKAEKLNDPSVPHNVNISEAEEVDVVRVGCELPPNYLIDPLTRKSVWVEALNGTALEGEQQQQQLMYWIDAMKQHGHRLPRTTRQRQAEILSKKLGEELGVS